MPNFYPFNRPPLKPTPFSPLSITSIKPEGWLKNQLIAQKNGLTGHLEEIWPDVGMDSGWLGGKGENWERGPYYLDGLIPLAYLLNDQLLIKKAQKWIEWMFSSQKESGFFGPENNLDWWPRMVALKVLVQYHSVTDDDRVIPFMTKYLKYQLDHIDNQPLHMWATARGLETLIPIYYLYNHTGDEFLLDLAKKIYEQSYDWTEYFNDFPYKKTTHHYLNQHLFGLVKKIDLAKNTLKKACKISGTKVGTKESIEKSNNNNFLKVFHLTHTVNIVMALKMPSLYGMLSKNPIHINSAKKGIQSLKEFHGLPIEIFTGDEHLNGPEPTKGAELCSVVEYMYTLEELFKATGDTYYADILERLAYNALPATISEDMCSHQYVQQVNQVKVSKNKREWYDAYSEANLFGLEPNFGCCTANMHQGWPKFAANLFYKTTDGGLATGIYGPCSIDTTVRNDVLIALKESTDYPFKDKIRFSISTIDNEEKSAEFAWQFRIPDWCQNPVLTINGVDTKCNVEKNYITVKRVWLQNDDIELTLPMATKIEKYSEGSAVVKRGPLLFGLKMQENYQKLKGNSPFADYQVTSDSPWNFALDIENTEFDVKENDVDKLPFASGRPPVVIRTKGYVVDSWKMEKHSAGPLPKRPLKNIAQAETITLIPYGSTNLRIAQFPIKG